MESTIVAVQDDQLILLRPGTISREALAEATGAVVLDPQDKSIKAPGMLLSHYAPNAKVRLNATHCEAGEAALNFGSSQLTSEFGAKKTYPPKGFGRSSAQSV